VEPEEEEATPIGPDADGVFTAVEVMPEPRGGLAAIHERLRYPADARRQGISGTVMVELVVDERGRAQDVRVLRGPPALGEAAMRAVRLSRFTPGRHEGEPVKVRISLPIRFMLR
jgi:periplasmic protein TonB